VCPFITEELWAKRGHDTSVHQERWPTADLSLLVEDDVQIVVQVNGKQRGRVSVPRDSSQAVIEATVRADTALADIAVDTAQRVVHVKNRLVNFVIAT